MLLYAIDFFFLYHLLNYYINFCVAGSIVEQNYAASEYWECTYSLSLLPKKNYLVSLNSLITLPIEYYYKNDITYLKIVCIAVLCNIHIECKKKPSTYQLCTSLQINKCSIGYWALYQFCGSCIIAVCIAKRRVSGPASNTFTYTHLLFAVLTLKLIELTFLPFDKLNFDHAAFWIDGRWMFDGELDRIGCRC